MPDAHIPPLADALLGRAVEAISRADALLICAGAGMGVDSGLPDFRGGDGFWRAYPPLAKLGISFEEMASPEWFYRDVTLAWGFYGHRLNLYRRTQPHEGFSLLRDWARAKPAGYFVYTSNVDGHFQKAGFDEDRIAECHGSLNHLQCVANCSWAIWSGEKSEVTVDEETLRATPPVPTCPNCGFIARPNVLMFDDWHWLSRRSGDQEERLEKWLKGLQKRAARLTIIECGAGRAIPTVRWFSDRLASGGATLIRINPTDTHVPPGGIALPMGALTALRQIAARLGEPQ